MQSNKETPEKVMDVGDTDEDEDDSFVGEYLQLLHGANEDAPPLTLHVRQALERQLSSLSDIKYTHTAATSWYGHQLTPEEATTLVPDDDNESSQSGLVWYATLIPDELLLATKLSKGLNKRDFEWQDNKTAYQIKPRRPSLPVNTSDFFSSLTQTKEKRYIFHGVLNGWPSLQSMELVAIEQRRDHHVLPTPKEILSGHIRWSRTWSAATDKTDDPRTTSSTDPHKVYRAKLRSPSWTSLGWSATSPGFCFWYEPQRSSPCFSYGTDMLTSLMDSDSACTHVHMIAHRYATASTTPTPRDLITYHTACLLEWDHGRYCTVVELAFLNGMGGYKGKSNWYHDKDDTITELYESLPPECICPWKETRGEIRCFDVQSQNLEQFLAYMETYKTVRFVDPRVAFSHKVRLTFRSKVAIAQYLLNYSRRDSTYAELKKNCQTFAADFCAFLAGKKSVPPFHPVSRIDYQNRTYLFLYDPTLYS